MKLANSNVTGVIYSVGINKRSLMNNKVKGGRERGGSWNDHLLEKTRGLAKQRDTGCRTEQNNPAQSWSEDQAFTVRLMS